MHRPYTFRLTAGLLLAAATAATAQERTTRDLGVMPEVQGEWALRGQDYVVASFNLRGFTYDGGSTFAGAQLFGGYEHFWNDNWSWGGTLRYQGGNNIGTLGEGLGLFGEVSPGLLLRHTSSLGSFRFGQRLGAEYYIAFRDYVENRALSRLRLDVERPLRLGSTTLRPRVAYEVAAYLRFQRDENELKQRFIDYGTLRGEIGFRLSPRFDFTPWVAAQTAYYNALPQYDALGNQTRGGRTNSVGPVVGLDARFTFLGQHDAATRQQLPTQH